MPGQVFSMEELGVSLKSTAYAYERFSAVTSISIFMRGSAAFNAVLLSHFSTLGWMVLPFTVSVAASRLVLGLHYPSDVLAGVLIGAAVAWVSLMVW